MSPTQRRLLSSVAFLLCALSIRGDAIGGDKQILIEARFVEVAQYEFNGGRRGYPYLQFDVDNGVKFKIGKKFRKGGEKYRGIQMKAKQDNAAGFFSLGQQFSVAEPIIVSGTYQLRSMKGIHAGSTIGIEFDSPFVPVGGQFDNFIFAGARYEIGGLRAFANLNGSDVGESPMFADTTSLDIQAHITAGVVTIDIKPTESATWSNLVTDLPFDLSGSIGVGVGMFNVDKGAKAVAGCLRVEGSSIHANPNLTTLLGTADQIRENLAMAHDAMSRRDENGDRDPDISGAETYLGQANSGRIQLTEQFETAWNGGLLDPDTPYRDIMKRLDKAGRKLVPVLGRIPGLGKLFRSSDRRRVRKADLHIFVTAKLLTIGDED